MDEGGAKIVEIEISAREKYAGKSGCILRLVSARRGRTTFCFQDGRRHTRSRQRENGISAYLKTFSGLYEDEFFGFSRGGEIPSTAMNNRSFSGFYDVNLNAGECEKYYFVFGGDYKSVVEATKENIEEKKNASLSYFEK